MSEVLISEKLPMLSVRQPFASLIVNGIVDVEMRGWRNPNFGPLLIHASNHHISKRDWTNSLDFAKEISGININRVDYKISATPKGCIIGVVDYVACLTQETLVDGLELSKFFIPLQGSEFGFLFKNPRKLLTPLEYSGTLRIARTKFSMADLQFAQEESR